MDYDGQPHGYDGQPAQNVAKPASGPNLDSVTEREATLLAVSTKTFDPMIHADGLSTEGGVMGVGVAQLPGIKKEAKEQKQV